MCGIAGLYSLNTARNKSEQAAIGRKLEQAIAHRGPDAADLWQDDDVPLTLCHRRLAIIDLSDDGRQPMHSHSGRYVVTYNGEIYNYLILQKELENAGIKFKNRSDTEVMLAAFEHWGINQALQKLNGMFAIVLWDRKERKLHFIRDRFGKKPLYVGWCGRDLVFSSELKSFHAHSDFNGEIDRDVLAQYMRYGYVHAPHCIFKNIWQMLPASRMVLSVDELQGSENFADKMQNYWSLKAIVERGKNNLSTLSEAEIIEEFEGKLQTAVSKRMISDVPFGAFLSGGIDSSSVVALMQKEASTATKTFSIGFDEAGYNEAEYAKEIATYLETNHQEFYVSAEDARDVIPKLPDIYDEPFADSSQIPTYLISKLARDQVTVVLTGDGGDEILGGYDRHTKIPALWNKLSWMPWALRKIICGAMAQMPDSLLQVLKPNSLLFPAQVKRALQLMGRKDADAIYEALITHWSAQENLVLNGNEPNISLKDKSLWPKNLNFAEKMMFGDLLSYRVDDLMVKTDRATMAVALEARAPLMDHELAEYCWTLPHHMKIRGTQGKWLLRQVLERHVPKALYDRPKMGFSVPIGSWLRGALKSWGDDLLSRDRLEAQGLLNADVLVNAWDEFQLSNKQDVPKHLWTALMFQAWYDRWIK
jgi:asparagine synthase (glutamine-hydrolysing)